MPVPVAGRHDLKVQALAEGHLASATTSVRFRTMTRLFD
jgi:hypothetical protein